MRNNQETVRPIMIRNGCDSNGMRINHVKDAESIRRNDSDMGIWSEYGDGLNHVNHVGKARKDENRASEWDEITEGINHAINVDRREVSNWIFRVSFLLHNFTVVIAYFNFHSIRVDEELLSSDDKGGFRNIAFNRDQTRARRYHVNLWRITN